MKRANNYLLLSSILILTTIFSGCESQNQPVAGEPEVVTDGFRFTEGPFWHPDGFLIFSDIPANTVYKWTPGQSESEVYIDSSGNSNGITAGPDGTIYLAQHAGRISRVGEEMELITVADEYNGMRLNSPNDVTVRSDGMIYFTDPTFGVSADDRELEFSGVYRLDPEGNLTLLFDEFALPNGITFSPDENHLYVNDSETGQVLRFNVLQNGDIESPIRFANVGEMGELGAADGMKTDSDGLLYTTGPNGLLIFDTNGNQIHQIEFDQQITNIGWGGENNDQLFITAPNQVYRLQMNTRGW